MIKSHFIHSVCPDLSRFLAFATFSNESEAAAKRDSLLFSLFLLFFLLGLPKILQCVFSVQLTFGWMSNMTKNHSKNGLRWKLTNLCHFFFISLWFDDFFPTLSMAQKMNDFSHNMGNSCCHIKLMDNYRFCTHEKKGMNILN